jgi:hypothetical protein
MQTPGVGRAMLDAGKLEGLSAYERSQGVERDVE